MGNCTYCGQRCRGRYHASCRQMERDQEMRRNGGTYHVCGYPTEADECPNCGALREERP